MIAEHGEVAEDGDQDDDCTQRTSLERVEVHQATGMIIGTLDVDQLEALVRLRSQAFPRGLTTAEFAREVVERRVSLTTPDWQGPADPLRPPR